jgi:hypothetical protein
VHNAVQRLRPQLLLAACPPQATRFEAATMYLYATTRGRTGRPGGTRVAVPNQQRANARPSSHRTRPPAAGRGSPLADFDTAVAAARFRAAVARDADFRVWVEPLPGGIRHRHVVHRVLVPGDHGAAAAALLAEAWQEGVRLITDVRPLSPSSARWRTRRDLAAAMWRAALLASQTVRTAHGLRLRTPSSELAAVLVRAARLLDVSAEIRLSCHVPVVCLPDGGEARRLLAYVSQPGRATDAAPAIVDQPR